MSPREQRFYREPFLPHGPQGLDRLVVWLVIRQWPRWPARLLLPYLLWIVFATALNASVWWLNR